MRARRVGGMAKHHAHVHLTVTRSLPLKFWGWVAARRLPLFLAGVAVGLALSAILSASP